MDNLLQLSCGGEHLLQRLMCGTPLSLKALQGIVQLTHRLCPGERRGLAELTRLGVEAGDGGCQLSLEGRPPLDKRVRLGRSNCSLFISPGPEALEQGGVTGEVEAQPWEATAVRGGWAGGQQV
jgi:hypothetical protein